MPMLAPGENRRNGKHFAVGVHVQKVRARVRERIIYGRRRLACPRNAYARSSVGSLNSSTHLSRAFSASDIPRSIHDVEQWCDNKATRDDASRHESNAISGMVSHHAVYFLKNRWGNVSLRHWSTSLSKMSDVLNAASFFEYTGIRKEMQNLGTSSVSFANRDASLKLEHAEGF